MTDRKILVASNRGPVSFVPDDGGELQPRRGAGGLVTALTGAVQATGGLWVASAMSSHDRAVATSTPSGRLDVIVDDSKHAIRLLSVEPEEYDRFYNGVSNHLLWFLHHALWDLPVTPSFDHDTRRDWDAYRMVNQVFGKALAEEIDRSPADVLIQDYHLSLAPAVLRSLAPQARIAYFHHIPFAGTPQFSLVPSWMRRELVIGLLGADLLGFQSARWGDAFLAACRGVEGTTVDARRRTVRWEDRVVHVGTYPISVDAASIQQLAGSPEVRAKRARLEERLNGRRMLLRVDRTEPSKNILRGFEAFAAFLRAYPGWRSRVTFLALLNPSRQRVPEYRAYVARCREEVDRINEEFGEPGWQPIELSIHDDFEEVVAAYCLYDALLVNSILDGMNLVCKEGPLVNDRHGVLLLSRTTGAFDELGRHAVPVDPLDIVATGDALNAALRMPPAERARRAAALRRVAAASTPADWVERQLRDLDRAAAPEA